MGEVEFTGNLIAGKWAQAVCGKELTNSSPIDPAMIICHFPDSDAADVKAAIEAAEGAQKQWAGMGAHGRGQILLKAAQILENKRDIAAETMTREMGKPIRESRGEIARSIDLFRYYGSWGWRLGGGRFPSATAGTTLFTVPTPLGVVALITPWNFPSAIPVWKLAPALVCGNTVVLKPASQAPKSAIIAAECLCEAGLPAGVLNIVTGPGGRLSEPLLTDPRIKAVSFTGSCAAGKQVFDLAASPSRRVGLELGGKNPLLVMADANLDKAVDLAAAGAMQLAGQKCTATSRVIVEAAVAKEFTKRLVAKVGALKTGNPLDETTDVGPVIDAAALESILNYIETGKKEGAKLEIGGRRLEDGDLGKGFYCAPTVFSNVKADITIAQEEIFGPVLAVLEARDFDDAISIANNVSYGLAAAICTDDIKLANAFIERIEAGLVHINSTTSGAEPHVPFGGMKASSSGFREMGEGGIEFFSTVKTVYYA
jgi:acyl-CoA reductase-like NAD-dependent aldehyde dehydrogenase